MLEDGPTKDGLNQILNLAVELVQGGVEGRGGGIDPTKDPLIDGILDEIYLGVDLGSVHRGLVQHVSVHSCGDRVREVVRRGDCLILVRLCDRTKGQEL